MKKLNFKKIAAMSMAAMMAVSAMSISAFAEDNENRVFAEIQDNNGNITYVYESDLVNGSCTVVNGDEVAVFETGESPSIMPLADTGTFSRTSAPISTASVAEDLTLTFNLAKSTTRYSPYKYYSAKGTLDFTFVATSGASYSLTGCVKTSDYLYKLNLYDTSTHSVTVYSTSSSNTAYAYVSNSADNGSTATGSCKIRQI